MRCDNSALEGMTKIWHHVRMLFPPCYIPKCIISLPLSQELARVVLTNRTPTNGIPRNVQLKAQLNRSVNCSFTPVHCTNQCSQLPLRTKRQLSRRPDLLLKQQSSYVCFNALHGKSDGILASLAEVNGVALIYASYEFVPGDTQQYDFILTETESASALKLTNGLHSPAVGACQSDPTNLCTLILKAKETYDDGCNRKISEAPFWKYWNNSGILKEPEHKGQCVLQSPQRWELGREPKVTRS